MGAYFADTGVVALFSNRPVGQLADQPSGRPVGRGLGDFPQSVIGDLWMWPQLRWLQFEVVRGPTGVVWGRFGGGWGAPWAPNRPQIGPTGPRRTSHNLKLQPHELQPHP